MPWPAFFPPANVAWMWATGAVLAALAILGGLAVAVALDAAWHCFVTTRRRRSRR